MRYNIVTLLFLFSLLGYAQFPITDWEKENLKGKVKSVKSITYQYINDNGKMQKGSPMTGFNTLVSYNIKGYKISGEQFSTDEKIIGSWVYIYEGNNLLRQVDVFNQKKQVQEIMKHTYNSKTQKEDVNGYDANGVFTGKQIACYDEKGLKINELLLDSKENFLMKSEFIYDSKSNLSERYIEDKEGKKVVLKYVYDEKNNVIEENYYGNGGQLYGQKKFTYKYDNQGNWIERIEEIYGMSQVLTERKITYY